MTQKIYVGNLSFDTTRDGLKDRLEAGGFTVNDVYIPQDRDTGRSRGFAFVELGSPDEVQRAIEALDGADLDGRNLRVNEARERAPRPGGGRRD